MLSCRTDLFAPKDESLLIRGDAQLILYLFLECLDYTIWVHLEGEGFARQILQKDLHHRNSRPLRQTGRLETGGCKGRHSESAGATRGATIAARDFSRLHANRPCMSRSQRLFKCDRVRLKAHSFALLLCKANATRYDVVRISPFVIGCRKHHTLIRRALLLHTLPARCGQIVDLQFRRPRSVESASAGKRRSGCCKAGEEEETKVEAADGTEDDDEADGAVAEEEDEAAADPSI